MKFTMSSAGRAEACPPSTFLPRIDEVASRAAERGRAIHAFLCNVALVGRDDALLKVPKDFLSDCEVIDLERMPHLTPDAWAFEVGLAWDWENDSARELFRNSDSRDYSGCRPAELAGTCDVLGATSDSVIILDVKTGYFPLGPPEKSLQLLSYAVAAARAYNKPNALVGWIRLRDGQPCFEQAFVPMLELDQAAARMRATVDAGLAGELLFTMDPSTLALNVGPHCKFCPSFRVCPANVSLLGELVRVSEGKQNLPVLDAQTAPLVLQRAEAAQKVIDAVIETVKTYAEAHPFDLPNGDRYGKTGSTREKLDGLVGKQVLEGIDPELANRAVEVSYELTKAGLDRAVQARLPAGKKKTHYVKELLDKLREAGAARAETYYSVRRFKPKRDPRLQGTEPVVVEQY